MRVTLVAHTPNPDQVCDMASRTCTSSDCPGLSSAVNRTRALEHALASGHESVAEHAVFMFQVEGISRACSHQLVRHRLASYSQQSQRYVNMDGFEYAMPDSIRNHERSNSVVRYECVYDDLMNHINDIYKRMVRDGIPEEDARYILPNACCTNITITMNGRQLRKFFMLRGCNRAQWEIRVMANLMLAEVKQVAPIIFENAGASCDVLGYCPEQRSCGKCQKLKTLLDKNTTT